MALHQPVFDGDSILVMDEKYVAYPRRYNRGAGRGSAIAQEVIGGTSTYQRVTDATNLNGRDLETWANSAVHNTPNSLGVSMWITFGDDGVALVTETYFRNPLTTGTAEKKIDLT